MYEIPRNLSTELANNLERQLEKYRVVHITGPNCCGKTHIVEKFLKTLPEEEVLRITGKDVASRIFLMNNDESSLWSWANGKKYIFIDDAQRIERIETSVEMITKGHPEIRVIICYSTRSIENIKQIRVYPVSLTELRMLYRSTPIEELLKDLLVYGSLPSVLSSPTTSDKHKTLDSIVNMDILKDMFELEKISNSKAMMDLLYYLALHINETVAINKISRAIGLNPRTTLRYITMLKTHYIIHEHHGYKNKLRNEIDMFSRFYFYDLGIRNTLLSNFSPIDRRSDIEQLWANFLIMERHKFQEIQGKSHSTDLESYYWQTWENRELDLLEVGIGQHENDKLRAYKFYFKPQPPFKYELPKTFRINYPDAIFQCLTPGSFTSFIEGH